MTTKWTLVAIFESVILGMTAGRHREESLDDEEKVEGVGERLRAGVGVTGGVLCD